MNDEIRNEIRNEIAADAHGSQQRALERIARRLEDERPVPRAGFRGELRRRLEAMGPPVTSWRPARLRVQVAAYLASGAFLIGVAAVGLAGIGPLAA
jgi:hypothetical protein